jgi:hypothetical protein
MTWLRASGATRVRYVKIKEERVEVGEKESKPDETR